MPSVPLNEGINRICSDCGTEWLGIDDIYFNDNAGGIVCHDCNDRDNSPSNDYDDESDESNDDGYVNSYGYKPERVFFINDEKMSSDDEFTKLVPTFGVELETEQPSRDTSNMMKAASYAHAQTNDFIYLKEDCSLRNGFEIVSHPATLNYWQNHSEGYQRVLLNLRSKGFRAWTTSRCGLHIHISKNSFVNPMHEMKFIYFIFRNKNTMVDLVGRNSPFAQYNLDSFLGVSNPDDENEYDNHSKWSSQYPKPTLIEIAKGVRKDGSRVGSPLERNLAVNRSNKDTHELRIFRPSLLFATVLSYIEFVHCLFEYTKQINANDILRHEAISKFEGLATFARDNRDTYPNFIWKMHTRPNVSIAPEGWVDNPHQNKKRGK
jgi:hypothetical protein